MVLLAREIFFVYICLLLLYGEPLLFFRFDGCFNDVLFSLKSLIHCSGVSVSFSPIFWSCSGVSEVSFPIKLTAT